MRRKVAPSMIMLGNLRSAMNWRLWYPGLWEGMPWRSRLNGYYRFRRPTRKEMKRWREMANELRTPPSH